MISYQMSSDKHVLKNKIKIEKPTFKMQTTKNSKQCSNLGDYI